MCKGREALGNTLDQSSGALAGEGLWMSEEANWEWWHRIIRGCSCLMTSSVHRPTAEHLHRRRAVQCIVDYTPVFRGTECTYMSRSGAPRSANETSVRQKNTARARPKSKTAHSTSVPRAAATRETEQLRS